MTTEPHVARRHRVVEASCPASAGIATEAQITIGHPNGLYTAPPEKSEQTIHWTIDVPSREAEDWQRAVTWQEKDPSMTTEDYLAYVREYQRQLLDACILARAGLADPTIEEQEEMDALYSEEDPFEEQAFVLVLTSEGSVAQGEEEDAEDLLAAASVAHLLEASRSRDLSLCRKQG